jgi:RNA polymerase sigma-70 factor (ECF subfamily)
MPRLSDAYREEQSVIGITDLAEELESILAGLFERGRARYPEIALSDVAFARHLARCGAPLSSAANGANAENLFIACAAVAGDATAVATLRDEYRPIVVRYVGHIRTSGTSIEDLEQNLWSALLVGDVSRPPKLASYSGIGSLAGFIGVSAQRLALRSLGHEDAVARAATRATAQARMVLGDAELDFARQHYRDEFERAVRAALHVLDDRQRMILRMQVIDGLTVDRIAKVYNVSQSTVSRWLEKARSTVLQEARRALGEIVSLTESEFNWLIGVMTSQLDISISGVLRSG